MSEKEEKKSKKFNKKILIAVLAVVIIIVVIVAVIIVNNQKNNNPMQTPEQTTEGSFTGEETSLIDMNNDENAKIENGVKENTSENVLKDRKINNLSITDIKLATENGISHFTATVKNESSQDFAGSVATIKFTNEDGSDYATLDISIPEIKAEGTNSIDAGTTADITNAYDFTIELAR